MSLQHKPDVSEIEYLIAHIIRDGEATTFDQLIKHKDLKGIDQTLINTKLRQKVR